MPLPYTTPSQLKQLEKQVENLRQQGAETATPILSHTGKIQYRILPRHPNSS